MEVFVGIDWGEQHHQVHAFDDGGGTALSLRVPHDRSGLERLRVALAGLGEPSEVGVAIERREGLLVDHLLAWGHPVYPVNRRWAGYIRESTRGQADRYGPELQRAEQERFAERYGLLPAGLEYLDLVSGKDTVRRSDFARMITDAETGRFEVLLCYDTSRFARNVADAWSYRDRLARAGVVVVFCADTLISGNVDTYERRG